MLVLSSFIALIRSIDCYRILGSRLQCPFYLCITLHQNWTVHGLYWGSYRIHRPAVLEDSVNELLSWVARGLITIRISHTYRLPEVRTSFHSYLIPQPLLSLVVMFEYMCLFRWPQNLMQWESNLVAIISIYCGILIIRAALNCL